MGRFSKGGRTPRFDGQAPPPITPHDYTAPRHPAPRPSRAFTLIELILVLAVIAIVTAVTLPNFVGSIRGSRLRSATRSLVMAGRYARSMAVLRQVDMILVIDLDKGELAVQSALPPRAAPAGEAPAPAADDADPGTPAEIAGEDDTETPVQEPELSRRLERVTVEFVRIAEELDQDEAAGDITAGTATIVYRNNGRCMPYTVRLVDEDEIGVTLTVDALASATTRRDGE